MRIVGGRHRGRRLAAPGGCDVRPTADRVREAVFNLLAHGTASVDLIVFASLTTTLVQEFEYARGEHGQALHLVALTVVMLAAAASTLAIRFHSARSR